MEPQYEDGWRSPSEATEERNLERYGVVAQRSDRRSPFGATEDRNYGVEVWYTGSHPTGGRSSGRPRVTTTLVRRRSTTLPRLAVALWGDRGSQHAVSPF